MAEYIRKIRTTTGDKEIDYEALANKPFIPSVDESLLNQGDAADAKAVGDALKKQLDYVDNAITTESITNALGYKPANQEDVSQLSKEIDDYVDVLEKYFHTTFKSNNLYHIKNVTCPDSGLTVTFSDDIITVNGTAAEGSSIEVELEKPIDIGTYYIRPYVDGSMVGKLRIRPLIKWEFATDDDIVFDPNSIETQKIEFKNVNSEFIYIQTHSVIFNDTKIGFTISENYVQDYFKDSEENFNLEDYYTKNGIVRNHTIYVSPNGSDTTGDGSYNNPFATIYHANETIADNSYLNRYTIVAKKGEYTDLQTSHYDIGSTGEYQGVICKNYVYYESEDIGNPQDTVIIWDGATGSYDKLRNNIIDKTPFHIVGNTVTKVRGFTFNVKNLRYAMHIESSGYGAYSDWEVSDCIFNWGGRPDITDDAHNAPCIGLGLSPLEVGKIKRCYITNTESGFGLQTHDNVSYMTKNGQRAVLCGSKLVIEENNFNNCDLSFRTLLLEGRLAETYDIAELTNNINIRNLRVQLSGDIACNWKFELKANRITNNNVEDYIT